MPAEEAKLRGLFWSKAAGPVDLRARPELFAAVFPGYGGAEGDGALWRRYFGELFDQTVLVAPLGASVSASSLGGLDLFRARGGDLALLGVSDTFIPVPAGVLADALAKEGVPGLKVLQLARGNETPEAVLWYARGLRSAGRRLKVAAWGVSLTYVRRDPLRAMMQGDLRSLYLSWKAENLIARWDRKFPHPTWDLFVGPGLQKAAAIEDEGRLIDAPDAATAEKLKVALEARDDGRDLLSKDPADCDLTATSAQVDAAVAELSKTADAVFLFIPPTAPLTRRLGPGCALPALQTLVRAKAGPRVLVETADWDAYGLDYRDYVEPSSQPGKWKLDPIHANPGGATKIASYLAKRLAPALKVNDGARP